MLRTARRGCSYALSRGGMTSSRGEQSLIEQVTTETIDYYLTRCAPCTPFPSQPDLARGLLAHILCTPWQAFFLKLGLTDIR